MGNLLREFLKESVGIGLRFNFLSKSFKNHFVYQVIIVFSGSSFFNLNSNGFHWVDSKHEASRFTRMQIFIISPLFKPSHYSRLSLGSDGIFPELNKASSVDAPLFVVTESFKYFLFEICFRQLDAESGVEFLKLTIFKNVVNHNFI